MNASVVMSNVDVTRETAWPKRKLFESSLVIKVGSKQLGICGYLLKAPPTKCSTTGNHWGTFLRCFFFSIYELYYSKLYFLANFVACRFT